METIALIFGLAGSTFGLTAFIRIIGLEKEIGKLKERLAKLESRKT